MPIQIDCFKAYDIRGKIPDQLNNDITYRVGNANVEYLKAKSVVLGWDIWLSSEEMANAVAAGIREAGADLLDNGLGGTEMVRFSTTHLTADGGRHVFGRGDHKGIRNCT